MHQDREEKPWGLGDGAMEGERHEQRGPIAGQDTRRAASEKSLRGLSSRADPRERKRKTREHEEEIHAPPRVMEHGQEPRRERRREVSLDRFAHEGQESIPEVLGEDGEDRDASERVELGQVLSGRFGPQKTLYRAWMRVRPTLSSHSSP